MTSNGAAVKSAGDWTWIQLGLLGIGVVGVWHCALAIATPGHTIHEPGVTIRAAMTGTPFSPVTATAPTNMTIFVGVWVLVIATVVAGFLLVLRLKPAKVREGLASAARVTAITTASDKYRQSLGFEGRKPVYLRSEDTGVLIAPPRSGKTTGRVISGVIDAPGACVTTSTKVEVLRLTHKQRALKGRVHVFDPEGLSAWPTKTTWDIVAGCQDPVEAEERARAMVSAAPNGEGGNVQFFEGAATTVLASYLHAAALGGFTIEKVIAWATNTSNQEPYRILEENPAAAPSWRDGLSTMTSGEGGVTTQSVMMTLSNVLAALRTGPAVKSVLPSKFTFDVDQFLESTDTLYLLSEGGKGSAGPLTTALVATIERRARVRSQRTARGRFDVPVTLILDEAPNIAALPSLPALMTDSGGRGVIVWAISQSYAQLRARWGDANAQTMLNGAAALVVLGGIKEVDLLDQLTRLAGERRVERRTQSHSREGGSSTSYSSEWESNLRFDDIRGLRQGRALMWYLSYPPAEIDIVPWWKRKDAEVIRQSEREALALEGLA